MNVSQTIAQNVSNVISRGLGFDVSSDQRMNKPSTISPSNSPNENQCSSIILQTAVVFFSIPFEIQCNSISKLLLSWFFCMLNKIVDFVGFKIQWRVYCIVLPRPMHFFCTVKFIYTNKTRRNKRICANYRVPKCAYDVKKTKQKQQKKTVNTQRIGEEIETHR